VADFPLSYQIPAFTVVLLSIWGAKHSGGVTVMEPAGELEIEDLHNCMAG
jgi:hypothetical protein